MSAEATKPTLDYLIGEIRHLYDEESAALEALEEKGRAQRQRFKEARNTLSETAGSISEAEAERDGLAARLAQAQLADDPEAEQSVKDRFKELGQRIEGEASRRGEALETFRYADPWQVESAYHQSNAAKADALMREAEETRAKLMEALDASYRALNEKAERVRAHQKVHNSLRAASAGGGR